MVGGRRLLDLGGRCQVGAVRSGVCSVADEAGGPGFDPCLQQTKFGAHSSPQKENWPNPPAYRSQ